MDYYKLIFAIATFALFTFIFSLFINPIIARLKDIQQKLKNLIPPEPIGGYVSFQKRQEEIDGQRKKFVEALEEYKMEYKTIDILRRYLIYGAVLTFGAAALIFTLNSDFQIFSRVDYLSFFVFLGFLMGIGALISFAMHAYIPPPYRVTEWMYMNKHFNLSPSGIAACADIKIDCNISDRNIFNKDEPILLKIFSEIELRGYKYWIFSYDVNDKKIIHNFYGQIGKATKFYERLPDTKFKGWYTELIRINRIVGKEFKLFLFIFDPVIYGSEGSPYWGYSELEFKEETTWSSAYRVGLRGVFNRIKYFGEGLKFNDMKWLDEVSIEKKNEVYEIVKSAFEVTKPHLCSGVRPNYQLFNR